MIVGPGITIGSGVTVGIDAYSGVDMRTLLSASGQTAYDAAATDNFFAVSQTDYDAVVAGLSSVTKYALSDARVAENGSAWSAGFAQQFPLELGTVPSGVYLFGFISRTQSGGTTTPLISTTFKGTYTPISNSPNAASSGNRGYFLRKASAATAATSYIGIVNSGNGTLGTTDSNVTPSSNGAGYDNTVPYSTWTNWNGTGARLLTFQMLGTTIKQW
jgi:hypothetical protein